jgi:hypothetical protein
MKRCPVCNRTYADDTLSFCLDDGTPLSGPYDPHATLRMDAGHGADPAATEILPQPSVVTQPARPRITHQADKTLIYGSQEGQGQAPAKPGGKSWLIIGGIVAVALIGSVIALGFMAWRLSDKRVAEPERNSSTVATNSNSAANTNSNTSQANVTDPGGLNWLDGVWEGTGYQTNPKSTWTMKLTAQNNTYSIEYPSLSCRGKWVLQSKEAGKARFKEVITQGLNRCENNGAVLIEKISDTQLSFKYSSPNTASITSTAVLKKK